MFDPNRLFHILGLSTLMGILLTLILSATNAQNDSHPNSPLPEADEHMRDFAWFIGHWDVQSHLLVDAENDEWLQESLRTIHTYQMNGHIIFEHFFGPVGGEPLEAWSIRKYNARTGRWQQRWMDTSTPFIMNWNGTFNDAGEFVGYNEFYLNDEFELAGETGTREIFDNIAEDSFSWRYETTRDGGETWTVTWRLEYTRAAE